MFSRISEVSVKHESVHILPPLRDVSRLPYIQSTVELIHSELSQNKTRRSTSRGSVQLSSSTLPNTAFSHRMRAAQSAYFSPSAELSCCSPFKLFPLHAPDPALCKQKVSMNDTYELPNVFFSASPWPDIA